MDQPAAHLPLPKRADDLDAVRGHIERVLAGGDTAGALDLLFDLISRLRNHNEATQHRLLAALRKPYGRSSERFAPEEQGILQGILRAAASKRLSFCGFPVVGADAELQQDQAALRVS
jgi:hypothetical protein